MDKFSTLTTFAVALEADNIDTDQIMPKQFLRGIDKAGLDKGLFYNLKHKPDGSLDAECVLNSPTGQKAALLLAGPNFGCGSSREHAPWALMQYGFRCVIAPSFADIFYSNSLKNGLLPVTIPELVLDRLFEDCKATPGYKLTVDLDRQLVIEPSGGSTHFDVAPFRRWAMMNGFDDIGITLSRNKDAIETFEAKRLAEKPWLAKSLHA